MELTTYQLQDDGTPEEQTLFTTLPGTDYQWAMETGARIAFADEYYIQPDLAGRDRNRFFPTGKSPNIIIEVIRTHEPERETFQKLHELSKTNTIVVFYVIADKSRGGRLNSITETTGKIKIRTSYCMIDGRTSINSKETRQLEEFNTFEEWYIYLTTNFFEKAKKAAT